MFTTIYNSTRISFEAGLIQENLLEFSPLLQNKLHQRPLQLPPELPKDQLSSRPSIHSTTSPLSDVLAITKGSLHGQMTRASLSTNIGIDELFDVLHASKRYGKNTTILPNAVGLVPIISLVNIPDESLALFLSVFVDLPHNPMLTRNEMLMELSQFVPFTRQQQCPTTAPDKSYCATCKLVFNIFNWVHYTCCYCQRPLYKNCPVKVVLMSRLANEPKPLCSNCLESLKQQDVDDWTSKSVELIEIGTLESIKAALGCLTIALCLSDFSTKPVMRIAQAFVNQGMPELAVSFTSVLLEHSQNPKETMSIHYNELLAVINESLHSLSTLWHAVLCVSVVSWYSITNNAVD